MSAVFFLAEFPDEPTGQGEHVCAPLPDQEQTGARANRAAEVDAERDVVKVRMDADGAPPDEQHEQRDQHQRDAAYFPPG